MTQYYDMTHSRLYFSAGNTYFNTNINPFLYAQIKFPVTLCILTKIDTIYFRI